MEIDNNAPTLAHGSNRSILDTVTIHHCGRDYQAGPGIVFEIIGKQETAGSKTMLPVKLKSGATMMKITEGKDKEARARSVNWRSHVQQCCLNAKAQSHSEDVQLCEIWQGPLYFSVNYYVPRPNGHYKKNSAQLSKDGISKPYPISRPDVLKLTRAVEDALKDVLYKDDAAIIIEHIGKFYSDRHATTVTVRPLLSPLV
jgi:Holliday junction resolvase RusA-like endonuclease